MRTIFDEEGAVAISTRNRCRRVRVAAPLLAVALGLAACSSSGAGELSTAPTVSANGQHYAFAPGSVAHSQWPQVCTLLTAQSAAAALGTAVTTHAFHDRCYYSPENDSFPTLTVTILAIGSDQQDAFDRLRDTNVSNAPRSVKNVGQAAITYPVAGSPTVNLDVLADQGLFEISLRSPVGNVTGSDQTQLILAQVGRAIAAEFAS